MTRGGHIERHRLSDAITAHRGRELEIDIDSGPILGTFLNFDPSVVTWDKFGDNREWRDPLFSENQCFETHRCQRDATHASEVRSLSVVVVGGKGWSERVVFIWMEQIPDDLANLIGRGDPPLPFAILFPSRGLVDICV